MRHYVVALVRCLYYVLQRIKPISYIGSMVCDNSIFAMSKASCLCVQWPVTCIGDPVVAWAYLDATPSSTTLKSYIIATTHAVHGRNVSANVQWRPLGLKRAAQRFLKPYRPSAIKLDGICLLVGCGVGVPRRHVI